MSLNKKTLSTTNPKSKYKLKVVFVTATATFFIGIIFVVFLSLNIKANNTNKDLFLSNLYSSVLSQSENNQTTNPDQKQNKIRIAEAIKITLQGDQIKQTKDIYQKVKEKDNVWSEITKNQVIKITFEKPLTNKNDITIFARSSDPENTPITAQVYAKYQQEKDLKGVVVFNEIKQARSHKVLLTNLKQPTDTFYLKIGCETIETCGTLEIDYITDPTEGGITINSGVEIGSGISMGTGGGGVPEWTCGDTLVDTRDSKEYATEQIGDQCWMAENLDHNNGCASITWVNYTDVGWCGYYAGGPFANEGLLYQWSAVMAGSSTCNGTGEPPNDKCATPVQGICPDGWHIPSHYEFTTLERAVCTSGTCVTDFEYNTTRTGWRGTTEGDKLKKAGLCEGRTPCGTSGFDDLLAGSRTTSGSFNGRTSYGDLWSSTQNSSTDAWYRVLSASHATVSRNNLNKANGFSLRCLKD